MTLKIQRSRASRVEWCAINRISRRTGTRILAGPDGPIVTRLSAKRFGITRGNNAKQQRSRERRT
jgi:hypothetical protein